MNLLDVVPTEWLIVLVVVALALADSLVLLDSREVLINPASGKWAVVPCSRIFTLRGKATCLLNPLLLHRPVFRLTLGEAQLRHSPELLSNFASTSRQEWDELRRDFNAVCLLPWVVATGLFVLLPLGLFTEYGHVALWAALACIYVPALAGICVAWRDRHALGLSVGDWASLAFDVLACPPHALNLVRKLSLLASRARLPDGDLLRVAASLFSGDEEFELYRQVAAMVDELTVVESDEAELATLRELRTALSREISRDGY
ncbi:hypothetical protein [Burkholderia sp. Bp9142]|uniref:hypothetical protein n=1 Tax=Burkholderia sp. Bp9142 TaxID=2184573 RepID=UPI000F5A30B7|nr:hypothetical protein [Burkholderia sp. Bp9142]RQR34811.1 hypothetical protein DIE22_16110 [Burkholderia sp. Bp9142]